jgi:16S rRNA (cytosine967-C5)-methyltransferase
MFTQAYLDTAGFLLQSYQGVEPFHLYLKSFFAQHKKYGARDRKHITQLCYCWFRAGNAVKHLNAEQQFRYALFLCSEGESKLLEKMDAGLVNEVGKSIAEKVRIVEHQVGFQLHELFPWTTELSPEIESALFYQSLLQQPKLFLRLRPGREQVVTAALRQNAIPFELVSEHCIALDNSTKVDSLINIDTDAVIQDLNSQQVLNLVKEHGLLKNFDVWDCCAASGGKSLLLFDTFSNAHITVSDVRENILHNLRARFRKAGVKKYRWFVGNAAAEAPPHLQKFDLIICDAPCSGSGTWGRTPEQLHHFKTEKITAYAQLQKNIATNVSRFLKPGGLLLYSTCSLFKRENEEVVSHISENTGLSFLKSAYYKGYDKKGDTLFAALFKAL